MLLVYIYIPRPTFLIVVFFYTDNCLHYRVIDFLPPRCPSLFFLSFVSVYYAPDTSWIVTSDTIG